VGTLGGGAARLERERFTTIGTREGLPNLDVFAILEDRDGNVWIGTGGGGLARLRDNGIQVLTSKTGLPNDTVLSLMEDSEGSLWAGTDGGGLTRLQDSKFVTLTKDDGLSHDIVVSIYEDARGDVWLGTLGGGVNRVSAGMIRSYTTRDGLSSNMVFSVAGDRSGAIWIGTHAGLNRLQDGRFTHFTKKDGLASSAVSAIYEDRGGALWFGTPEGVSRLRDGRFTTYTTGQGLPANFVLAVLEDRRGMVWLGTAAGLARFDGRTFTTLTSKDGLADDLIMALHEDTDGVLWVATRKGLSRLIGGTVTTYTRKDGLFDDLILATIDDHHGSLWVSSNNGVFRLAKRELADFAARRVNRIHSTAFGVADGLRSIECNGGVQPSAAWTRRGAIWFPTVKGAAFIEPLRIRTNQVPPPVKIEGVIADEQALSPSGPLRLHAGTHRLEVHFAGLSFAAPERVQFRYMLAGFDSDWIDAGTRRTAVYTNLAPGHYSFRVIAANNDGRWSTVPAVMIIEQKPFFHQTVTFAVLCGLGGIALIAYFLIGYAQRIKAEYVGKLAERGRIARELHDTLAQELVSVQYLLNLANEAAGADLQTCRRHIGRASEISKESLREVRRVLADLRPSALEEDHLGTALQRFATRATDGSTPAAKVIVNGTPRSLPPEIENDLLRIGQEAITNALRHAHASRVDVELTYSNDHVHLCVRDDGVGVDEHDPAPPKRDHYGVTGMRERATRMSARFMITSTVSAGTEISVEVKA
jgi:ligand-binding sensor domain-containing protein/two-component sensor histidine kinase